MAQGVYALKRAAQLGNASLDCNMSRKYFFCVNPLIVQHFCIAVAGIIITNGINGILLTAHSQLSLLPPIIHSSFPQK